MPINQYDKERLAAALATFEPLDCMVIARLIYEVLFDACSIPSNKIGLSPYATTSLGRAIYDKIPWARLPEVEKAIGGQPIRLSLIRSADTILRTRLVEALSHLSDEHKNTIAIAFEKMNELEIVAFGRLVYDTLCNTGFPITEPFSGVHPLSKFLYCQWTWDDLKNRRETAEGICVAIGMAVDTYFRQTFVEIFILEAPSPVEEIPDPAVPPEVAAAVDVAVAVEAAAEAAEHERQTVPVGGASDLEPFDTSPEEDKEEPLGAQEDEEPSEETAEAQNEQSAETQPETETSPKAESESPPVTTTPNGRISKRQRREMKRKEVQS